MTQKAEGKTQNTKWEAIMDFLRENALVKEGNTKPTLTSLGAQVLQGLQGPSSQGSRVSNPGDVGLSQEGSQS